MGVEIDKPIINDKSLRYNYTNEGGVGGKIRFLKNIMGLWLVQECRRHWLQGRVRPQLRRADRRWPPAARPFGPVFDPDHKPFGLPGDMPGKIDRFCRRDRPEDPRPPAARPSAPASRASP